MLITFNLIALFIKTRHVLKTSQLSLTKGPWTQGLQNIFQSDKQVLLHRQSSDCTPSWFTSVVLVYEIVLPRHAVQFMMCSFGGRLLLIQHRKWKIIETASRRPVFSCSNPCCPYKTNCPSEHREPYRPRLNLNVL